MYQLSFDHRPSYHSTASGIEVPVSLSVLGQTIDVVTKVDTGATSCIFAREVGYELGLDIESGQAERFVMPNGGYFHCVRSFDPNALSGHTDGCTNGCTCLLRDGSGFSTKRPRKERMAGTRSGCFRRL